MPEQETTAAALHVILGPAEYDPSVSTPVSKLPDWHSHPLLGIDTGHYHKGGRRLHGHYPRIEWGDPVFIEAGQGEA